MSAFPTFCSPHGLNNTGAELWKRPRIKYGERMRACATTERSPAFRRGTIFLRSQPGGKVKQRHARKHFPLPVPQPLKAFSAAAKISSL